MKMILKRKNFPMKLNYYLKINTFLCEILSNKKYQELQILNFLQRRKGSIFSQHCVCWFFLKSKDTFLVFISAVTVTSSSSSTYSSSSRIMLWEITGKRPLFSKKEEISVTLCSLIKLQNLIIASESSPYWCKAHNWISNTLLGHNDGSGENSFQQPRT